MCGNVQTSSDSAHRLGSRLKEEAAARLAGCFWLMQRGNTLMDERVASMREFVATFWISETLLGEFDSGCVAVSNVFQSSRESHLCNSLTHESIAILLGARREGITEAAHKL